MDFGRFATLTLAFREFIGEGGGDEKNGGKLATA